MSVHIAKSLGQAFARRTVLPLVLLTSVECDSDLAQASAGAETALSVQTQRGTRNPVIHWNSIASELMVDPGPIIDSRAYAILHTAIHDAVNGVDTETARRRPRGRASPAT